MRYCEFGISFAIAVKGIQHFALIGHNNCGMANLAAQKDHVVEGLVNHAGWDRDNAETHFSHSSRIFEIKNAVDFVLTETRRLRQKYLKINIAPMFYSVDDHLLYLIYEK